MLWMSDFFPEKLPGGLAGWVEAFLKLFHEPFTAMAIYGLTLVIILASWLITEILFSLIFAILATGLSFMCLLGFLSVHFASLKDWLQALAG